MIHGICLRFSLVPCVVNNFVCLFKGKRETEPFVRWVLSFVVLKWKESSHACYWVTHSLNRTFPCESKFDILLVSCKIFMTSHIEFYILFPTLPACFSQMQPFLFLLADYQGVECWATRANREIPEAGKCHSWVGQEDIAESWCSS